MSFPGEEHIKKTLESIVEDIKKNLRANGQYASGHTESLFAVEVSMKNNVITGSILGPEYIQSLITGRGPTLGGQSGGMTLQQKILEWIKAKGIPTDDPVSASWAISKHIHKYGTQLYQRSGDTGILANNITDSRISAMIGVVADKFAEQTIKFNEIMAA